MPQSQDAQIPTMVPFAFILGVIIWSTTPLGIVWSSESVHPTMAVLLRMLIALALGFVIILCTRIRLPMNSQALKLYAFSTIGMVGGMLLSYFAARYIGSGTISLIFGLAPIISGLLAQKILGEPAFSKVRLLAFAVAFLGLGVVCFDRLGTGDNAWVGIGLILGAVSLFSLSAVLVKTVNVSIHPLASTVGTLSMSTPLFALAWVVFDGTLPVETWQAKSLYAIIYLGIIGSLVASVAYFYILQHLRASTVTLVTLITPAFAMMLGALLNGESITANLLIGAGLVLSGLSLYQFGEKCRWLSAKAKQPHLES
ncbi:DMT family transporter [Shewanella corallii]|uniref:DMT family transporter n=1 Tax=Shewanella corallii TaxID=560080 RepID=A0ABT0N4U2_9GAMM|nr:DMT family transporter [Shewanella corallii]MCL2913483.1 DMT family transporter [Shewanella corallii]